MTGRTLGIVLALLALAAPAAAAPDPPFLRQWRGEFPLTAFERTAAGIEYIYDIAHRDAIPTIERAKLVPLAELKKVQEQEPVISVVIGGDARAYPLQVLTWSEIVNDEVGGVPIAVTYSPLCNSVVVFDRRLGGKVLTLRATGRVKHANLIMYDTETESWWQQYTGEAIVGARVGQKLAMLPVRIESLARFRERAPNGFALVPNSFAMRPYGQNPYPYYDTRSRPDQSFQGTPPKGIAALARVVSIGEEAWSLDLLRAKGRIVKGDLELSWEPGQVSALDAVMISTSRDIGNVTVRRLAPNGARDEVHNVGFAFAFHAFHPNGAIYLR